MEVTKVTGAFGVPDVFSNLDAGIKTRIPTSGIKPTFENLDYDAAPRMDLPGMELSGSAAGIVTRIAVPG